MKYDEAATACHLADRQAVTKCVNMGHDVRLQASIQLCWQGMRDQGAPDLQCLPRIHRCARLQGRKMKKARHTEVAGPKRQTQSADAFQVRLLCRAPMFERQLPRLRIAGILPSFIVWRVPSPISDIA